MCRSRCGSGSPAFVPRHDSRSAGLWQHLRQRRGCVRCGIPNANVSVTELTKNIQLKAVTNESGNYHLGQLIPRNYRVEVEAKGFRKAVTDTEVRVDQAARADFALELGA